ncbi:hypothetical protein [Marinilactibacillus kalidii]|uniref:hypothetical protein n=1 Tax=Marinilactibacillus kalidii TaxID=2820274 RepID=UPI001FC92CCE|nr:hypothetical protein [Marinilactibacillus kalidii]
MNTYTKSYGRELDEFAWNDHYIVATGRHDHSENTPLMYYIINKDTTEYEVYVTKENFENDLKRLDVHVELKGREYYDWYE